MKTAGFFTFSPAKKPKPTLSERIRGLLAGGRVIVGRGELAKQLWPDGRWTLEDTADLNLTLNRMIRDGEVVESRREQWGAVEWDYRLGREPE